MVTAKHGEKPGWIRLKEFADLIAMNPDTVYRWGTRGVKDPNGPLRIKMKMTRLTDGWGVTIADYNEFIAKLNEKP